MKQKISLFTITILFFLAGCKNSNQKSNSSVDSTSVEKDISDKNIIKVYVDKTGVITADGNTISLENLDSSFSSLMKKNGTVYYSRDNVQGDPPEESMKVMELITKYSLPVRFYTDKTFSKVVKMN